MATPRQFYLLGSVLLPQIFNIALFRVDVVKTPPAAQLRAAGQPGGRRGRPAEVEGGRARGAGFAGRRKGGGEGHLLVGGPHLAGFDHVSYRPVAFFIRCFAA